MQVQVHLEVGRTEPLTIESIAVRKDVVDLDNITKSTRLNFLQRPACFAISSSSSASLSTEDGAFCTDDRPPQDDAPLVDTMRLGTRLNVFAK